MHSLSTLEENILDHQKKIVNNKSRKALFLDSNLLKVSSSRPEENKIRQEDLSKIISNAQKVQIKQETIESQLSALKR